MRVRYRIDGVLAGGRHRPGERRPRRRLAHQDPLRPRHRRAPRPAGRPHLARGRRQADRPPRRRRCPRAYGEKRRHAHPRPEQGHDRARAARHARRRRSSASRRRSRRPTAPCSSPARPAPASRPRSTPRSTSSTRSRRTSSRSRTRSSTSSTGSSQVQVNNKAGLTFAAGLRSILRADPDIIMVGEIRDRETAQIAIEAALTGHLVLSHAAHQRRRRAPSRRLIDMGIEPFLVGSAVDCVVAQRLARLLCEECKRRTTITVRGHARQRLQRRPRPRGLRARRLRALRRLGLQGPDRPLRGHVGQRHDPLARRRRASPPRRSRTPPCTRA